MSLAVGCALMWAASVWAVPAKPGLIDYSASDGRTISVKLIGDEHSHYYTTEDDYVLLRSDDNSFTYAKMENGKLVTSGIRATNMNERSVEAKAFLATIDKRQELAALAKENENVRIKRVSKKSSAPESQLVSFPVKGSPRACVILVEFADKKFTLENPHEAFYSQLNEIGYSYGKATGSVRDYFTASSNAQFTPQFDVYGPVTLSHEMSYYGGNDSNGNDIRPYEMVPEACALLDSQIDFSIYDADHDGVIDNIYLYYAGYGEADGGPKGSVWPHSWDVKDAGGLSYYFDGKLLNHYACSNELKGGSGQNIAGIGTFCHEFSHVMGLPDLYSTTYSGAFTPGTWTILDHGSYNNDCMTPPAYTAYERYCMGWLNPKELKEPSNISMVSMGYTGHYGDAYILHTSREYEYYIFENRQKIGWDSYIPGHGMLVWHINFDPDIWALNMVNVSKQYVDIVEADDKGSSYNIEGDPFPGTANVTSFTDDTTPSMITWTGERLYAPITDICESEDGTITFAFKGGIDIFDKVVAKEAADVRAGSFVAQWNRVDKADSYLLSVYTKDENGRRAYIDGFNKAELGNVNSYKVTGLQPLTTYYYEVCATDGKFFSAASNEVSLTTLAPTIDFKQVTASPATEIGDNSFVANWEPLAEAQYYTLTVFTKQLGEPFTDGVDFSGSKLPDGWTSNSTQTDSRTSYSVTPPSLRFTADGKYLQSPEYNQDVRTVGFWYRGNSSSVDNSIDVLGNVGNDWTVIQSIKPIANTAGGQNVSVASIPDGVRQVKIVFNQAGAGSAVIDDVKIGYGGNFEELPIAAWNKYNVGNVTSYKVTGLEPSTIYSYSVIANADDLSSKESERIQVKLTGGVGTVADGAVEYQVVGDELNLTLPKASQVAIYDITGRCIASKMQYDITAAYKLQHSGIYIVKTAGTVFKVVIK